MRASFAGLALLLLLAACQVPPPLPPLPLHASRRLAHRSASPSRRIHMEQQSSAAIATTVADIPLQWQFSTSAGECVAEALGEARSPGISVHVDRSVHVTIIRRGYTAHFTFTGPGGSWSLHSTDRGRDATITMPLNDATFSNLRKLLEGGQFRFVDGYSPVTLQIPDAGISGRDWIGCVSAKEREVSSAAAQ